MEKSRGKVCPGDVKCVCMCVCERVRERETETETEREEEDERESLNSLFAQSLLLRKHLQLS